MKYYSLYEGRMCKQLKYTVMKKITYKPELAFIGDIKQNGYRIHVFIMLFALLISVFPSCVHENYVTKLSGEADGSERKVILRMSVPYKTSMPQRRSIDASAENMIQTVDVLAFRVDETGEYYDYSAVGYKTPGNMEGASMQSFTVTVRAHAYQQRFVTITNARTVVQQLIGSSDWHGMEKEAMLTCLEVGLENDGKKWNTVSISDYASFPMWGESKVENITNITTELSAPVILLRMLAKINVQLDKSVEGLTDIFKLKSVRLYNVNTKGRVVPETGTLVHGIRDNNPYLMVSSPSIPTDAEDYNARHLGPELYQDFSAPGERNIAIRGAIYLFETRAVTDNEKRLEATCLVIGGLYGEDTEESYYRLDFLESDKSTFRHILRNNQYITNIVAVKDRGHSTPDEAFKSIPGGMVADIGLEVSDAISGETLTELAFASEVGVIPDARYMDVHWMPDTVDLTIVNTPLSSIAFPSESGVPVSGTVAGGIGTASYVIQPPAFTPAETTLPNGDPFLEKVSRLDFTISTDSSSVSRSVLLRQICYNLITDQADYYLLDGSTYTFNVKCNAAWRIKSIVESRPILASKSGDNLLVGTTGGNNTSEGNAITFTVVNSPRSWGTIEVTFESEDTPGKFRDKTITLVFAARRIKLLGIAYANIFGYNPAVAPSSGLSANTMLSTSANFGTLSTSKVITEGFTFIGESLTTSITDAVLKSYMDEKPDIIVIGFDLYISVSQAEMYLDYLRNGGTLIAYSEGNASGVERLMRAVFNNDLIEQDRVNGAAGGNVYALPNTVDNILNGPFGDVRNLQWGDDASQTCGVMNLPLSEIEVYSTAEDISGTPSSIVSGTTPKDWVTAFRHKSLKLVWFGDGGFLSSSSSGSDLICPFKIDVDSKIPVPCIGSGNGFGRGTKKYNVYNSQIFANTIAWAISGG